MFATWTSYSESDDSCTFDAHQWFPRVAEMSALAIARSGGEFETDLQLSAKMTRVELTICAGIIEPAIDSECGRVNRLKLAEGREHRSVCVEPAHGEKGRRTKVVHGNGEINTDGRGTTTYCYEPDRCRLNQIQSFEAEVVNDYTCGTAHWPCAPKGRDHHKVRARASGPAVPDVFTSTTPKSDGVEQFNQQHDGSAQWTLKVTRTSTLAIHTETEYTIDPGTGALMAEACEVTRRAQSGNRTGSVSMGR